MREMKGVRDLVILAADKDLEQAMQGILSRPDALGTREISFVIWEHPRHDAGCRLEAATMLRPFSEQYRQALVVFDQHGSGAERNEREGIEEELEESLGRNGWGKRATVVVLDPELEVWVWSQSPEVDRVLGWQGRAPSLREWLIEKSFLPPDTASGKPDDPKRAMWTALRKVTKQPSPALFKQLAQRVSLQRCNDPAFLKMKGALQRAFPRE